MRGQALVEFAIVAPVLFTIILGVAAIFILDLNQRRFQNGIDVLAESAASSPAWAARVPDENARTGCHADPLLPAISYPDGLPLPGNRVRLVWSCHLQTRWIFDGLPITVESEAVIR